MELLQNVLSHWDGALAVIVVLGGLIFFHELGHFAVARLFGMGVRTFSLGFGPKLINRRMGRTDYCLSLVPLGGYVSLVGQDPEEPLAAASPDELSYDESESFGLRPAWQRMLVVLAGPVANFVVALFIYWGVAWSAGESYLLPVVGGLSPNSPAISAGIEAGDRVLRIDGKPIETWAQVAEGVAAGNGQALSIVVERKGEELSFSVTPEAKTRATIFGEEKPAWLIGVASGQSGLKELSAGEAVVSGVRQTWNMIALTVEGIGKLFARVVPLESVGGPIMIAQMVVQQAQESFVGVLLLAALISINLGILNLLPIPILDGGHILFFLVEIIFRRPVTERVQEASARVGMVLLLGLMVLATWNDLVRLFS